MDRIGRPGSVAVITIGVLLGVGALVYIGGAFLVAISYPVPLMIVLGWFGIGGIALLGATLLVRWGALRRSRATMEEPGIPID